MILGCLCLTNGKPEEVLLFVLNFIMTLADSGILMTGAKIQHMRTQVQSEALRHFDYLSDDMESTETLTVDYIINELAL